MTKKEELIQYIQKEITDENTLKVYMFHETPGVYGPREFGMTKEEVIELISNSYDDELIGQIRNENTITHIISWG